MIPVFAVGHNIQLYETAGEAVAELNGFLKTIGVSIGVILLLVGIVKLIMASMDENPKDKKDASVLFGVSVMFISISNVLATLGVEDITSATSVETVASRVIELISSVLSYAGMALAVVSIVTLILSITQENPEQQASGIKLLFTAVGLLTSVALATEIKADLLSSRLIERTPEDYINTAIKWFAYVMSYAGVGFVIIGVFRIILGIRTEEAKDRETGEKFLIVGIALLSFWAILSFFGIETQ